MRRSRTIVADVLRAVALAVGIVLLPQSETAQAPPSDLAALERQAAARGGILGNPNGSTVLFEFFDYNCGYCRNAYPFLIQLTRDYPDLKIVLVEYPILGADSRAASQHALQLTAPAYRQVFTATMTRGGRASGARIISEAETAGRTLAAPDAAALAAADAHLAQTRAAGTRLGFNAVPGFYVAGQAFTGADKPRLVRAICGYSGRGSCSSFHTLLVDAAQERAAGGVNVRRFLSMASADARRLNNAADHNSVCWEGALLNEAATVMSACRAAVELASNNASYRDSRGLALALTGDLQGAAADWAFYIARNVREGQPESASVRARRAALVRATGAAAGRNEDLIELLR
jgi:protein-disulfide isomerase